MKPIILCHRGVYREQENELNSIAAVCDIEKPEFQLGVEFDIQFVNDQLVCYHDPDIIEKGDLCTLQDIIKIIENKPSKTSKIIDIELKTHPAHSIQQVSDLAQITFKLISGLESKHQYILTSHNIYVIRILVNLNRTSPKYIDTGLIIDNTDMLSMIELNLTDYLIINKTLIYYMNSFKSGQYKGTFIYTIYDINNVDDDLDSKILSMHDYGIITDDYSRSILAKFADTCSPVISSYSEISEIES